MKTGAPKPRLSPVVWRPPAAPDRAWQPRSAIPLPPLTTLPVPGTGPEDVAVDDQGRIITGLDDGRVLRLSADGGAVETLCETGGRPLGIERLGDDQFLICDAYRGLLRLSASDGSLETLFTSAAGRPLRICNNAAVAADGTIYFSDSSQRVSLEHWKGDLIEHSGTGRLLRVAPGGQPEVILDGLQFANGVALAADESFVAVAESGGYCVKRVALQGSNAGAVGTLIDNLPGFPDNISTGTDGLIWITIGSRRDRTLDRLAPLPPLLRRLVWSLPEAWLPAPVPTVWVMAVDDEGTVVHDLQAPGGEMSVVTGVREVNGRVYLGSLVSSVVAYFDLPSQEPTP